MIQEKVFAGGVVLKNLLKGKKKYMSWQNKIEK